MRLRILYWVSTAQIALVMAVGGLLDAIRTPSALDVFHHLGYPTYFATLLGVAKLLGVAALIGPVPRTLREWAYAGFAFDVTSAIVSILAVGDAPSHVAIPLYALAMLLLSHFAWRRAWRRKEGAVSPSTMLPGAPQSA